MMTFEQFRSEFEKCRSAAPSCQKWALSFTGEKGPDFGREWRVSARSNGHEAIMTVPSATFRLSDVPDYLAQLGTMLAEFDGDEAAGYAARRAILSDFRRA